ncbi:hypothetical protein RYH80_08110 [Halobaculum sp. MBLA0147]|uniref:hypothetical protein n=1 Tax=Halobaculum sp. MBLA0147 TaxID=3079934 RepID=UPI0035240AF2
MTDDTTDRPETTRRTVAAALASAVSLTGCLGAGATGSGAKTPTPPEASGSETLTRTAQPTPTATETPTATDTPTDDPDTPTPTPALNQTQYDVELPFQTRPTLLSWGLLSGVQERGSGSDIAASVRPIRSEAEWQRVLTNSDPEVVDAFEGNDFVVETDFGTETLVIFQRDYGYGLKPQIESIRGVGTPEIAIRGERVGTMPSQARGIKHVFVRLPTDGDEIDRITVQMEKNGGLVTVIYDETGASTPSTTP